MQWWCTSPGDDAGHGFHSEALNLHGAQDSDAGEDEGRHGGEPSDTAAAPRVFHEHNQ